MVCLVAGTTVYWERKVDETRENCSTKRKTYRRMSDKIGHTDELATVCVDVSLIPGIRLLILRLDDMSQGDGPIGLDKVLERGIVAVVGRVQLVLDGGKNRAP
jgi:hypothetical protein